MLGKKQNWLFTCDIVLDTQSVKSSGDFYYNFRISAWHVIFCTHRMHIQTPLSLEHIGAYIKKYAIQFASTRTS